MVAEGIGLDDLHRLQLLQAGLLCYLVFAFVGIVLQMPDVGDVAHISDFVAEMAEEPDEHVVGHAGTGMAEVGVTVNGRSADVYAHVSRIHRNEEFLAAAKGIRKKNVSHFNIYIVCLFPISEFAKIL